MPAIAMIVAEGNLEVPAALRILDAVNLELIIKEPLVMGGCEPFWKNAIRYNHAAKSLGYILGLTDLDAHECPSKLLDSRLPVERHPNFLIRIQVRELESWLLADTLGMARFFAISQKIIPTRPDDLSDPKQAIVNLARRCTKKRLKEDIVPDEGRPGPVGPGYTPRITEFIQKHWDPERAAQRSPSLARALKTLRSINDSPSHTI